ncbi:11542_t:CDS:2 [Entrophospora sp. SA101]|nr:11542_t:CDS:2 [Entrophospora sp. SA101]
MKFQKLEIWIKLLFILIWFGNLTIDKHGAKTVQVQTTGNDKNHFTCALTILADDTKLPPIVIFKALFVMDSFEGHKTDSIKKIAQNENTDLAIIPGGLTSVVQPLDVCINKPFKDRLCEKWNTWMSSEMIVKLFKNCGISDNSVDELDELEKESGDSGKNSQK